MQVPFSTEEANKRFCSPDCINNGTEDCSECVFSSTCSMVCECGGRNWFVGSWHHDSIPDTFKCIKCGNEHNKRYIRSLGRFI